MWFGTANSGLRARPEPLQFHRGGDHREGLARADDVGEQRVRRLQDAPDTGLLMRLQLISLACTGQASGDRR
jgi:hypothetical protein